ncbi:MAG TPA: cytochrome c [Archangium sp.]|jgi:mono/diheme cytochrome c family protein
MLRLTRSIVPLMLTLSCARAVPSPQTAPPQEMELAEPRWLPEEARALLSDRMERHGEDMTFLLPSVVLLNYRWAEGLTERIAAEPRLARAGEGDADSLNARLPKRFFELQDEVRARAREVSAAAQARDDARLARTFGELTQTCVACHALYLHGAP